MCDQFLGIGVPAPIYADKYDELGLGRNMLSRTLEDAGTLWAVMFPWTGCGAYQTGVLGMSPLVFFPYAFVNLLNPVYAYAVSYTHLRRCFPIPPSLRQGSARASLR